MNNYYDEVLEEISDLKEKGQYEKAYALVQRELDVPYVPKDIEEKLNQLLNDLKFELAENRGETEKSLSSLLDDLKKSPEHQLAAAAKLTSRNLRECIGEVCEWLAGEPYPEAAALIVEAIAQQDIRDEFVWNKDGVEYTFYGDSIVEPSQSGGFLKAYALLKEWLENDNPDYFEMAKTLLIHEVYMFLPLSYEAGEGRYLAESIMHQLSDLLDEEDILSLITHEDIPAMLN